MKLRKANKEEHTDIEANTEGKQISKQTKGNKLMIITLVIKICL